MCISPIRIKNPNLGLTGPNAQFKDRISHYINVPCGVCPQCVANRQMQYVQRLQMEEKVNHLFMCTLTYSNEMMPIVSTTTGYDIRYADVSDVQKMMKRLRKRNAFGRPFRYFGVSELGTKKGRPHFHILFMLPKYEDDDFNTCLNLEKVLFDAVLTEWRRNYGTWKKPDYKPLCTYVRKYVHGRLRSNYDLHYVNPTLSSGGSADVAFYVLKYMMKPSNRQIRLQQALKLNLPEDEYEDIWKLVRCRHFESERFGLGTSDKKEIPKPIYDHLRHGLDLSKSEKVDPYPSYFSPLDGSKHPLAKYYKSQGDLFTMQDFLDFFYASSQDADNVIIPDVDDMSQLIKMEDDFADKQDQVEFQNTANELDDLFDFDDSLFLF